MRRLPTLALLLAVLLVAGCDRAFTPDIESQTPPELHVFVRDADARIVTGATVSLYRTEADRDAGANAFHSGTTDATGKLVATEQQIGQPGVVYVSASKDGLSGQGATPYLLLTDGVTYFHLTIQ